MSYLFTSESVSEGHPDKVADQISDAILDQFLAFDEESKVACETLVTTGQVMICLLYTSNAVMELFDVEISCNKRAGNRYTIDGNSIRSQKKVNQWLLDNFTFNTLLHQYQDIHDRVIFEEVPSYDSVYLFGLLDAIQQNRQIEIVYQSFALGGSATLRLYPCLLYTSLPAPSLPEGPQSFQNPLVL